MTEHARGRGGDGSAPQEHLAPVTYLHAAGLAPEAPARMVAPEPRGIARSGANGLSPDRLRHGRPDLHLADVPPVTTAESPALATGPAESETAARLALRQLARHDMTRWEVQESLRRHGIDDQVAHAQVAELIRQGLLDDRALATTLVETRFARKGLGRAGMRRELQRRHIGDGDIEAALAGIPEAQDRDRALGLARARAAHREAGDPTVARRRLSSYLARRGYPASLVMSVVHEVMGDTDEESGD